MPVLKDIFMTVFVVVLLILGAFIIPSLVLFILFALGVAGTAFIIWLIYAGVHDARVNEEQKEAEQEKTEKETKQQAKQQAGPGPDTFT
ncbi:MAG: hypothetical protein DRH06_00260 [Deltaproteobacteria bacterium]|nr:MAG: hypothetical protein DRH06_00260 [Deltaproteobacteria bacterium]